MTLPVTEAQWQRSVVDLARYHGWWVLHHPDSRRATEAGMPDLTLVRPPRLLFAELKTARGQVRPDQAKVFAMLADCGAETVVWRPGDMDIVREVLAR